MFSLYSFRATGNLLFTLWFFPLFHCLKDGFVQIDGSWLDHQTLWALLLVPITWIINFDMEDHEQQYKEPDISAVQRWSPNATHKRNGQLTVAHRVVCFAAYDFPKYFLPFQIWHWNRAFMSCNTSYSNKLWSIEAPRLCLQKPQLLWNMTGGWAALLPSQLSHFKTIGYLKYQSCVFFILIEKKQHITILVIDQHFWPYHIWTS